MGFASRSGWLLLWWVLCLNPIRAEIYRQVEPDGSVEFTDRPSGKAEKVNFAPAQEFTAEKVVDPALDSAVSTVSPIKEAVNYSNLSISGPAEIIRAGDVKTNTFDITVQLEPTLVTGDVLVLYDNDEKLAESHAEAEKSVKFTLSQENIYRGEHLFKVKILREEKVVKESNTHILTVIQPVVRPPTS